MCSILDIPGPRWFTSSDPIWRVHGDVATPIGITTGLLMLAADPAYSAVMVSAGADVAPWSMDDYLHDLVEISTFGTVDDAMVTIEHARRDHSSFSGTTEYGDYFYGSDPGLIEWSQAAVMWALLAAFQRFSGCPLSPAESDRYVYQWSGLARLHGARGFPSNVRELEQCIRRILLKGRYERERAPSHSLDRHLAEGLAAETLDARGLLAAYCRSLYEQGQVYLK